MSSDLVKVEVFELSRLVGGIGCLGAAEVCDATSLLLACDGIVTGKLVLFLSSVEGFGLARFRGLIMVHYLPH